MPYASRAQQRKFQALLREGKIDAATVEEFDRASKGLKLPEHVGVEEKSAAFELGVKLALNQQEAVVDALGNAARPFLGRTVAKTVGSAVAGGTLGGLYTAYKNRDLEDHEGDKTMRMLHGVVGGAGAGVGVSLLHSGLRHVESTKDFHDAFQAGLHRHGLGLPPLTPEQQREAQSHVMSLGAAMGGLGALRLYSGAKRVGKATDPEVQFIRPRNPEDAADIDAFNRKSIFYSPEYNDPNFEARMTAGNPSWGTKAKALGVGALGVLGTLAYMQRKNLGKHFEAWQEARKQPARDMYNWWRHEPKSLPVWASVPSHSPAVNKMPTMPKAPPVYAHFTE